jgi:hypothetical protein
MNRTVFAWTTADFHRVSMSSQRFSLRFGRTLQAAGLLTPEAACDS